MADMPLVTLAEAAQALELSLRAGNPDAGVTISGAIVGDLLSHIMAQASRGNLWITVQTHPNIVAVAALDELCGIIIADGFEPDEGTLARADEEGIPLYCSPQSAYVLAGRLYQLGVR